MCGLCSEDQLVVLMSIVLRLVIELPKFQIIAPCKVVSS